jgi:glutaredoxin
MLTAVIWSKNGCIFCDRAKKLLAEHDIMFEERNIQKDPWTKAHLLEAVPNAKTVPQIFLNGEYVGGFDNLQKFME